MGMLCEGGTRLGKERGVSTPGPSGSTNRLARTQNHTAAAGQPCPVACQGITARVESVLALRQAHGFAFGKSDLFVVLGMRPVPDVQVRERVRVGVMTARVLGTEYVC